MAHELDADRNAVAGAAFKHLSEARMGIAHGKVASEPFEPAQRFARAADEQSVERGASRSAALKKLGEEAPVLFEDRVALEGGLVPGEALRGDDRLAREEGVSAHLRGLLDDDHLRARLARLDRRRKPRRARADDERVAGEGSAAGSCAGGRERRAGQTREGRKAQGGGERARDKLSAGEGLVHRGRGISFGAQPPGDLPAGAA